MRGALYSLTIVAAGVAADRRLSAERAAFQVELVAGYHTEFSGVKFALIQAAEFGGVAASAAVIVTLFLSGWAGPASAYLGWLWFMIKVGIIAFIFIWIRATYPRLRVDQIMALAWKFLLPLSLINLLATVLEVFFLRDDSGVLSTADLWIMAGINVVLLVVAIGLFGNMIREKVRPIRWQPDTIPDLGFSTGDVR